VTISEHVILRYIERVLVIDIGEIEKKIVDEETERLIKTMKSRKVSRGDFSIIIKNNTFMTVITKLIKNKLIIFRLINYLNPGKMNWRY
jgi:pseudouridine-5'-phosphate glycosidase